MSLGGPPLTSTLILALTQSDALQRQLEESTRTIERLKRENAKLKQQIEELRLPQPEPRNDGPDLAEQLDHLFRKDAEKQAEIDRLRKRLAVSQSPTTSSPVSARKRARVSSREPEPLREISANSSPRGRHRHNTKPKALLSDRSAEAIAFLTEDGLDHNKAEEVLGSKEPTALNDSCNDPTNASPNERLQALLSTTAPAPVPLTTTSPRPRAARRSPFATTRAPEDDEPLRSRPVHRLNLSHFKVNPKYCSGMPFAFQEVVRNKEARKCLPSCTKPGCCGAIFSTLAKTLPQDPEMSEGELLLDFLGPGSEEKIKALTPLARTNLVHEARAKRLANLYGRAHRTNFDLPSSPPGYWSVDIECSQQHQDTHEQAKSKERGEVERRFQEAMNGGRWLFADE